MLRPGQRNRACGIVTSVTARQHASECRSLGYFTRANEQTASRPYTGLRKRCAPKVEVSSPHGEPTVRVRHGDDKNCSGEEWKGLKIVSKCSFSPSGKAGERRNALFP